MVFKCEGCPATGKDGEKCEGKDCKFKGKKFVKSCSRSGEAPHVAGR